MLRFKFKYTVYCEGKSLKHSSYSIVYIDEYFSGEKLTGYELHKIQSYRFVQHLHSY